jgi:predicted dehydrogenase
MMGETSHFRPPAMYCRRRAAQGDFGEWVHAEGMYIHHVDWSACSLREAHQRRWGDAWQPSKSGSIPLHYPTHSLGGFLSVMEAHATHVSAFGHHASADDWHRTDTESGSPFGNETALMRLSNGATATIKEHRWSGAWAQEGFSITGTEGAFSDSSGLCRWMTSEQPPGAPLSDDEMRDPLPADVADAWRNERGEIELGAHGGSHAYLVHEFVDSVARGRRPVSTPGRPCAIWRRALSPTNRCCATASVCPSPIGAMRQPETAHLRLSHLQLAHA